MGTSERSAEESGRAAWLLGTVLCLGTSTWVADAIATSGSLPLFAPRSALTFERAVAGLGTVDAGGAAVARFRFSNRGREPIRIAGIEGTCACARIDAPSHRLRPGESAEIAVALDTAGRHGLLRTRVLVRTDEPGVRPIVLSAFARVRGAVVASPAVLHVGELLPLSRGRVRARLRITEPVEALHAASLSGCVRRAEIERDEHGARSLAVEVDAPGNSGPLWGSATLAFVRTRDGTRAVLDVPVEGSVARGARVSPATIELGADEARVRVAPVAPDRIRVREIVSRSPDLAVRVLSSTPVETWIAVRAQPGVRRGFRSSLEVSLDPPEVGAFDVPVRVRAHGAP